MNICLGLPKYMEILKTKVKKRSKLNRKWGKHMNRQFTKKKYKRGPKTYKKLVNLIKYNLKKTLK